MKLVSFGSMPINDGVNYVSALSAGGQTPAEASIEFAERTRQSPVFSAVNRPARYLVIETHIPSLAIVGKRALQRQWYEWFINGVSRQLVISDDDGSHRRYVWAVPMATVHTPTGDGWEWETMLVIDGEGDPDLAWRSVTKSNYDWIIENSGDSFVIDNTGECDVYPVLSLTSSWTGGNRFSRFIAVWWGANKASGYPVDIVNGELDSRIIASNHSNALGNDIRVYVDHVETDYWLNGINSGATSIWVNLDFAVPAKASLAVGVGLEEITTLEMLEDIERFPWSGLLMIDSELFSYSGKSGKFFTGVTRGLYGSTPSIHTMGVEVKWIQHHIMLEYGGDPLITPITPDNSLKPIFKLTSSNDTWVYEDFFEIGKNRSGAWVFQNNGWAFRYGGNQGADDESLYGELGIYLPQKYRSSFEYSSASAMWYLFNPCGIIGADFSNGEKYTPYDVAAWPTLWKCHIRYSSNFINWKMEYEIPYGAARTWEGWSYNTSSMPGSTKYIAMMLDASSGGPTVPGVPSLDSALECSDVTVTLADPPITTIYPEISPFGHIAGILRNDTTGESLAITFRSDELVNTLVIDNDHHIVRRGKVLAYTSVIPDALRMFMLRLVPGENILTYVTEELVGELTINVNYEKRYLS